VSGFEQDPTFVGKSFEQRHTQYTHNPALIGPMPCTGAAMSLTKAVAVNTVLRYRAPVITLILLGRFSELRPIYQGCRALTFALARLSCYSASEQSRALY